MPKYRVDYDGYAGTWIDVEADSPDEAREVADGLIEFPTICAHCSGWGNDQKLDLGDDWEQSKSEPHVIED